MDVVSVEHLDKLSLCHILYQQTTSNNTSHHYDTSNSGNDIYYSQHG